jgi:hypothetical protein
MSVPTIGKKSNSRLQWAINPVTRVKNSKKIYDRKKSKQEIKKANLDG